VAVDGGAGHGEDLGDLGDGFLSGVVELLSQLNLMRGEFGFAPSFSASGARGGQAFACW
jgi:hypothetical protein